MRVYTDLNAHMHKDLKCPTRVRTGLNENSTWKIHPFFGHEVVRGRVADVIIEGEGEGEKEGEEGEGKMKKKTKKREEEEEEKEEEKEEEEEEEEEKEEVQVEKVEGDGK